MQLSKLAQEDPTPSHLKRWMDWLCGCVPASMCMYESQRVTCVVGSLLPWCGLWKENSGYQTWWQVPIPWAIMPISSSPSQLAPIRCQPALNPLPVHPIAPDFKMRSTRIRISIKQQLLDKGTALPCLDQLWFVYCFIFKTISYV